MPHLQTIETWAGSRCLGCRYGSCDVAGPTAGSMPRSVPLGSLFQLRPPASYVWQTSCQLLSPAVLCHPRRQLKRLSRIPRLWPSQNPPSPQPLSVFVSHL